MVTFLSGGTGTPKLLSGARERLPPESITVVCNTGDDVELGGLLVCPDVDTVLYEGSERLDTETWWGVAGDTAETHEELAALADAAGLGPGPRYLPAERQTEGRYLARHRRFSAFPEFMHIGDRDRALHLARTSLLDSGHTLTEATRSLAATLDVPTDVVPASDDPVATIVDTPAGEMHFQEFWVARGADPTVEAVEFRGADRAHASPAALAAIRSGPVVIGPSNPVTSVGPMAALDDLRAALEEVPVVAVSPFVEDEVFSGPAADLMAGVGRDPSTAGVATAYTFADAFVLDTEDATDLDRPVVRTDTRLDGPGDATRVVDAAFEGLADLGAI